jgi:Nif-specific regulatory protein
MVDRLAEKRTAGRRPAELALLFEISQILDSSLDLHTVVEPVLEKIARSRRLGFAALTLLSRHTGEIAIEAAHGLSSRQQANGRYRLGEGITGRVIQSGEAAMSARRPRTGTSSTAPVPAGSGAGNPHSSACP